MPSTRFSGLDGVCGGVGGGGGGQWDRIAATSRPLGGLEHGEVELRDRENPPLDDQGNVYAVTNTSILVACDRDGTSLWTYSLPDLDDSAIVDVTDLILMLMHWY